MYSYPYSLLPIVKVYFNNTYSVFSSFIKTGLTRGSAFGSAAYIDLHGMMVLILDGNSEHVTHG